MTGIWGCTFLPCLKFPWPGNLSGYPLSSLGLCEAVRGQSPPCRYVGDVHTAGPCLPAGRLIFCSCLASPHWEAGLARTRGSE